MTETKECPNCGKWMIKWETALISPLSSTKQKKWMCACGQEEFIKYPTLDDLPKTFNQTWQEANKGEE